MTELQLHKWLDYLDFDRCSLYLYPLEHIEDDSVSVLCCNLNGEPNCLVGLMRNTNIVCRPCTKPPALVVLRHSRVIVTSQGVYTLNRHNTYEKQI